jgi:hypothetical protein
MIRTTGIEASHYEYAVKFDDGKLVLCTEAEALASRKEYYRRVVLVTTWEDTDQGTGQLNPRTSACRPA